MISMTVRIPDELAPRIRMQAWREHLSVNKMLARMAETYLDEKEAERERDRD